MVDEITLMGPRCGTIPPALRLLEPYLVDPTVILIEEISPLQVWVQATNLAQEKGKIKVSLRNYPHKSLFMMIDDTLQLLL